MTRKPGKDEIELWRQVARSTNPMRREALSHPTHTERPKVRQKPQAVPAFNLGELARHDPTSVAMPEDIGTRLGRAPVQMDRKAFTRMKRGKLVPDGRIDLHGKTLDQAHVALTRFVLARHAQGDRLLLVITGKGSREDPHDPMPVRRGVLKRQVPLWLQQQPLASAVLQIAEAHRSHGGEGAYYVYLRRAR